MESGFVLPHPAGSEQTAPRGHFAEIWKPPYRQRTLMLIVFNVFQIVGYYGFSSWVPTFLIRRGISVVNSLEYTFLIAIAAPLGPLLAYQLADRFERKWQIVASAAAVGVFGLLFGQMTLAPLLIALGMLLTMSNNILSFSFHAYQAELYPRASARWPSDSCIRGAGSPAFSARSRSPFSWITSACPAYSLSSLEAWRWSPSIGF